MRRSAFLFCFVFFAASAAVLGCKDDETRPPAASDTGQPTSSGGAGGGSSGSGGDGGSNGGGGTVDADSGSVCNTLVNDGAFREQNLVVGAPPDGTGGTIADGTYELTAVDLYSPGGAGVAPGPTGVTYQGVLRLTNGKLERVTKRQANQTATPVETRSFGDLVAGAQSFTVSQTCPTVLTDQYSYSVATNTLNITNLITKESFTFTLR